MNREHMNRHIHDVRRLVDVAASNHVTITQSQAYMAWSRHSEGVAAGWLIMPDSDDDLWFESQYEITKIVVYNELPEDGREHIEDLERIQRALHTVHRYLDLTQVYDIWVKAANADFDPHTSIWEKSWRTTDEIVALVTPHLD